MDKEATVDFAPRRRDDFDGNNIHKRIINCIG